MTAVLRVLPPLNRRLEPLPFLSDAPRRRLPDFGAHLSIWTLEFRRCGGRNFFLWREFVSADWKSKYQADGFTKCLDPPGPAVLVIDMSDLFVWRQDGAESRPWDANVEKFPLLRAKPLSNREKMFFGKKRMFPFPDASETGALQQLPNVKANVACELFQHHFVG